MEAALISLSIRTRVLYRKTCRYRRSTPVSLRFHRSDSPSSWREKETVQHKLGASAWPQLLKCGSFISKAVHAAWKRSLILGSGNCISGGVVRNDGASGS